GRSDPRRPGGRRDQYPAGREQTDRSRRRKSAALSHCECGEQIGRSGCGQAGRDGGIRQRRAPDEANPSRSDGAGLSVSAPDGAHRGQGWRESRSRRGIGDAMGQKVHPYGFRLGVTKTWRSRWFAKQDYSKLLHEDLELKKSLLSRLKAAGVSSIEVDRPGNKLRITIRTSRPGIIIGRKGAEIEKLKGDLAKKTKREIFIDIQEVHRPELDAQLVSESIALQLEKRVAFRRAMRKSVDSALRFG